MADLAFTVDIPQLPKMLEAFAKAPLNTTLQLRYAVEATTIAIQRFAKQKAPFRKGALRNSIGYKVDGLNGMVYTNLKYARYVEEGTGLYGPNRKEITRANGGPFMSKLNPGWGSPNKAGYYFIGYVIRGMEPQPFMEPAREKGGELIEANVGLAIDAVLKEF